MKLEQRTLLITGGTSGIGLELARQLQQRGNTVLVTGRDQERLDVAKRSLPGLHTFKSDVSHAQDIVALYQDVSARFSALDTLINNAGIMRNLNLNRNRDLKDVTREIEINLSGPVRMIQQFLPHLKTWRVQLQGAASPSLNSARPQQCIEANEQDRAWVHA
jgi:uncharacterized oxidoreductase